MEWPEVASAKSSPLRFAGVADERRKTELAFIARNSMRFRSRLASLGLFYATSRMTKSGIGPMARPLMVMLERLAITPAGPAGMNVSSPLPKRNLPKPGRSPAVTLDAIQSPPTLISPICAWPLVSVLSWPWPARIMSARSRRLLSHS